MIKPAIRAELRRELGDYERSGLTVQPGEIEGICFRVSQSVLGSFYDTAREIKGAGMYMPMIMMWLRKQKPISEPER